MLLAWQQRNIRQTKASANYGMHSWYSSKKTRNAKPGKSGELWEEAIELHLIKVGSIFHPLRPLYSIGLPYV